EVHTLSFTKTFDTSLHFTLCFHTLDTSAMRTSFPKGFY
uniref:Uncharacterized protein n=1 Tax=Aegilops tauschii subsp. strangulata TaxID=200361 RepID=A0A453K5U0_AEGTS